MTSRGDAHIYLMEDGTFMVELPASLRRKVQRKGYLRVRVVVPRDAMKERAPR